MFLSLEASPNLPRWEAYEDKEDSLIRGGKGEAKLSNYA